MYVQVTVTPSEVHPAGRPVVTPVRRPVCFVGLVSGSVSLRPLLSFDGWPGVVDAPPAETDGADVADVGEGVALGSVDTMASTANAIHIVAVALTEKPLLSRVRSDLLPGVRRTRISGTASKQCGDKS